MLGAYAGFGNPLMMPAMLHHPMCATQQRHDSRAMLPPLGTRGMGSLFGVHAHVPDEDDSEKLKRWNKEEEEALLEWLELPGQYTQ
jgi:hypothetical protein